jgi:hypothetical protein
LKQVPVPVRADRPVMDRRTRRYGFGVHEIERLIVRRIAVKMEQWKSRDPRHAAT